MTIQIRRDTAANWTSANPTLAAGQPGYETDTGKLKIGTGSTAWASLGYFSAGAGTVTSVAASGGTTGLSFTGSPITSSGTLTLSGTLNVANGGTGATTLTGYVKGSGTSALTASATIPTTDLTGTLAAGQFPALTGDVTTTAGALATTIANDAVTFAKMQNASGASVLVGRGAGAGAGDFQEITLGSGLSMSGTTLSASGSGLSDGDKGDITVSSSGTVWTIDNGAVSLAKMANMATSSLIYRKTAGTGAPEVQTLATLKTDLGLTGTNSGDQTITLTGDVTGSGTGSFAATLATVNASPQTDTFRKVTVNGKGLVTATSAVTASDLNSTFGTQTQNTVYAAPNGTNGTPVFRNIVAADIPTLNQNTTGSAGSLTTARDISISGDMTWTVSFNGSANVSAAGTLATVNASPQTDAFRKITVNGKGLVTATSAVTASDLNAAFGTVTQNTFYAGPDGVNSTPVFRSIVAADVPTLTTAKLSDFNSATRAQVEAALVAGTNITITPSGTGATRQLTIAASGSGGGLTIGLAAALSTANYSM